MKNLKKLYHSIRLVALNKGQVKLLTMKLMLLIFLTANPINALFAQKNEISAEKSDFFFHKKAKQVYKLGIGIENFQSGNCLGAFYSSYLSIGNGKNFFNVGPVIQKRSMLMQGAKIGYSRVLTGGGLNKTDTEEEAIDGEGDVKETKVGCIQLNFFCYAQYVNQLPLSYAAEIIEERIHASSDIDVKKDWGKAKFSIAELCTGFELHIKITQNISWKNYIGAAAVYNLNNVQGLCRNSLTPALVIGTGICIKHF